MKTESEIITAEQLRLSPLGGRIWRVVPGKLWKGFFSRYTTVKHKGKSVRAVVLALPTPMELFPVGEPDTHFFERVSITSDMVGRQVLLFGKAEIKTQKYKTVTPKQRQNLEALARMGGKALIIRDTPGGLEYEEVKG